MARIAEEPGGDKLGRDRLATRLLGLLVALKAPLLLVGERLAAQEQEKAGRGHAIKQTERRRMPERLPGRQRQQQQDRFWKRMR